MSFAVDISDFENDPRLFLFTSLTAGSSHIITATSRLETILKANKIPFQAIDTATDEKARRLWQRRAREKKLPGLVKDGFVIGDLEEIEEWNEFGELKDNIGEVPENNAAPPGGRQGVNIRPLEEGGPPSHPDTASSPPHPAASPTASALIDGSSRIALPGAAEMAERNKSRSASSKVDENVPPSVEGIISAPKDKEESVANAAKMSKQFDHLSAPASRIQSGAATPAQQAEPEEAATSGAQQERTTSFEMPEGVGVTTSERRHRGSEVREMSAEDIKKFEDDNALKEEDEEEEETQKQDAKEPADASKTVGD